DAAIRVSAPSTEPSRTAANTSRETTSWGSLVRAQYRPKSTPPTGGVSFNARFRGRTGNAHTSARPPGGNCRCQEGSFGSSIFGESGVPGHINERGLLVVGPARHRDAEELKRFDTGAAVLERGPDRNVDRAPRRQIGRLLAGAVSLPDLPLARENVP